MLYTTQFLPFLFISPRSLLRLATAVITKSKTFYIIYIYIFTVYISKYIEIGFVTTEITC